MDKTGFRTALRSETEYRPEGGRMVGKPLAGESAGYCLECGGELPARDMVKLMKAAA